MNNEQLNALKERAYKTAVEHGFHEDIKPNVYYLGLVMSEMGEAINADRKGDHADTKGFEDGLAKFPPMYCFNAYIKDSLEDEIADVVIRLLDFAGMKEYYLVIFDVASVTLGMIRQSFSEYGLPGILFRLNGWLINPMYKNSVETTISAVINYISDSFGVMTGSDKDLWWFVERKMAYNEYRPKLNGKKY